MKNLIDTYEVFRRPVESIRADANEYEYIGGGAESRVWKVSVDDDEYAVKIPTGISFRGRPQNTASVVKGRAELALRAVGVIGLEQIYAASPDDGASAYKYVQGISVSEMKQEDADTIPDDQLARLLETVEAATELGIVFDSLNTSGTNAFYCTDAGFTLIDYWQKTNRDDDFQKKYCLCSKITWCTGSRFGGSNRYIADRCN